MKKTLIVPALFACAVTLAAQEVPGTSASTLLNVGGYSKLFLNGGGKIDSKYIRVAPREDTLKIASLDGNDKSLDTPLEIALLSTCAGVIDIRPVDADKILPANNPRIAGLKLGSAVLKELAELKFLDPSNTAAIGRYEGMIKYISDKNGVSRAEIENYYRQGIGALIAETVNAEFNKTVFLVYTDTDSANVELIRKPNEYILVCDGYWGISKEKEVKQFSASSLEALLIKIKNSGNFSASATETVRAEAANIPAVFLAKTGKDPRADLTAILTSFYLNPTNQTVYGTVRDVNVYYTVARHISKSPTEATLCRMTQTAYINAIAVLSLELANRVEADSKGRTSITMSSDVVSRLQFVSLRQ